MKSVFYIAAVSLAASALTTYGAYTDGLVQYWDFSRGDTANEAVVASDIKDAMTAGSSAPVVAARIDGCNPSDAAKAIKIPDRVCFTNLPVQLPFYGNVTNERTCLWVPQETVVDGGTEKYFSRQVRLPSPTTLAGFTNRTVFMRFYLARQNGKSQIHGLYNTGTGHNDTTHGWGLCVFNGSCVASAGWLCVNRGDCWHRVHAVEVNGKKDPGQGSVNGYLYTERWYDMVVTVDTGAKTDNVNIYLCQAGKIYRDPTSTATADKQPDFYHFRVSLDIVPPVSTGADVQILFGDEQVNGYGAYSPTGWTTSDTHKHGAWGGVERVMVWNRVLSKEEAFDAMADATGRDVEIGAANSSAGEFAKESASGIAGVYDVSTMPWSRMRGELTAANPSLSFRFPLPEREEKLGKTLSVVPLLSGCGDVAKLELSVNGREAGTMYWKDGERCDLFVPGALMVRDDDGYVTMTLTRTGEISGTAAVDHVAIGGSWVIGSRDGSAVLRGSDYRPTAARYVESLMVSGRYASQYPQLLYGTNSAGKCYTYTPYSLRFEVSGKIAENHRSRFSFSTAADSGHGYSYTRQSIAVSVNGTVFAVMDGLGAGTALNTLDIPAGTFRDGLNVITLANVTDVSLDSYWGVYSPVVKFASHSLEFRNNAGAVILVR